MLLLRICELFLSFFVSLVLIVFLPSFASLIVWISVVIVVGCEWLVSVRRNQRNRTQESAMQCSKLLHLAVICYRTKASRLSLKAASAGQLTLLHRPARTTDASNSPNEELKILQLIETVVLCLQRQTPDKNDSVFMSVLCVMWNCFSDCVNEHEDQVICTPVYTLKLLGILLPVERACNRKTDFNISMTGASIHPEFHHLIPHTVLHITVVLHPVVFVWQSFGILIATTSKLLTH